MTNDECRLTNGGIASGLGLRSLGFAFSYDPTRRTTTPHVAFGLGLGASLFELRPHRSPFGLRPHKTTRLVAQSF